MLDIDGIVKKMSLKSKIALCSGRDEWHTKDFPKYGIPAVMMSDGPNGLRKQKGGGDSLGFTKSEPATCFPTESIVACSFDEALVEEMSTAIAKEAGTAGIGMVLGPGINIKRNPLGGRNFEYFSEDPFLSGRLGASYVRGVEKTGIGTAVKHFACNSQELYRMVSDSIIDERTLREIYLSAFEYVVKAGKPSAVMCAYNLLNGVYCSDNKWLLTDVLRKEWGFDGLVVTDWGALNNRSLAFEAGCDLAMPGGNSYGEKEVLKNIRKGLLSESYIDKSASRILAFVDRVYWTLQYKKFNVIYNEHNDLARRIAENSAVLLKNDDNILPCDTDEVAIVGYMAKELRIQGNGSSKVNPIKVDRLLPYFPKVQFASGYDEYGNTTDDLLKEAVQVANSAKKVIVVAGLPDVYEAEGLDRPHMKLPEGQNKVIDALADANPNVIVVLCCGSAVEVPWADKVKAILYMGLAGQAAAGALFNLLTGKANPCGKLAETWPLNYEDCPSSSFFGGKNRNAEYREGIYVGYRYYEKYHVPVRFPFGFGLSYTTFSYSNLHIQDNKVYVTVTNTGKRQGGEAVLLFIGSPQNGIHRPLRELKGFTKVFLKPGESREVSFELNDRCFAVWDKGWKVYAGEYTVEIGGQVLTIPVKGLSYDGGETWYNVKISRKEWLNTLSYKPAEKAGKPYTVNSTIAEIAGDAFFIRLMYRRFEKMLAKENGRDSVNYRITMQCANEMPLRSVQINLKIKNHFAQALADFGNKKFLKGLWHLIR
ncbi:MAG: Thermostable beta-glucosidase B [Lachnoclostridium sp.]